MAGLLISAAHKSSGKTTISMGLCAAMRQRGLTVQPFKKGPDYIDPMWLSRAAGRPCGSLDFWTMTKEEIVQVFDRKSADADVTLIEGNKGLYDGLSLDGSNSNAALATLLNTPVVLVLDARGMTRGIAPLILGYQDFDKGVNIAGVILNNLGGSRHEAKLKNVIEYYTNVKVVGAVHQDDTIEIMERHLGLTPDTEHGAADVRIKQIAEIVAAQVDIDYLYSIAASAASPVPRKISVQPVRSSDVKIGIARDTAFGFYYPDDLEALQNEGAELIPFDALNQTRLPDVDALFIGGGFPETHAESLSKNKSLLKNMREFIAADKPVYAECGGLMYLSRSLSWLGQQFDMAGALPADVVMHDKPQGRGYVYLRETGKSPWGPLNQVAASEDIPAHEFHYSSLENIGGEIKYAYTITRGTGIDGKNDGLVYRSVLASYSHLRNTARTPWAERFVDQIRRSKSRLMPQMKAIAS